jgi:CheY-like chemotaxis protein
MKSPSIDVFALEPGDLGRSGTGAAAMIRSHSSGAVPDAAAILIVDDDEGIVVLMRAGLEHAGLRNRIEHFSDGQAILDYLYAPNGSPAAVECHHAGRSYVILLDIRMPKVDGIQVLARLKSDQHLRRIPVIMVTTSDNPQDVETCYDLGCNGYVQKPVDYKQFAEAMRGVGAYLQVLCVPVQGRCQSGAVA